MFRNAAQAYEVGAKATASNRELEAAALFKSARQLEACRAEWEAPGRAERLEEALRYNQRLWTLFQTELARADHDLPRELRRNMLVLSGFVDRRTFELIADPERDKLEALIDINRNIASGLAANPA